MNEWIKKATRLERKSETFITDNMINYLENLMESTKKPTRTNK